MTFWTLKYLIAFFACCLVFIVHSRKINKCIIDPKDIEVSVNHAHTISSGVEYLIELCINTFYCILRSSAFIDHILGKGSGDHDKGNNQYTHPDFVLPGINYILKNIAFVEYKGMHDRFTNPERQTLIVGFGYIIFVQST